GRCRIAQEKRLWRHATEQPRHFTKTSQVRLRTQQSLVGIYPESQQNSGRREGCFLHIGSSKPHGRSMPVSNQAVVTPRMSFLFVDNVLEHAKMESEVRLGRGTKSAYYA